MHDEQRFWGKVHRRAADECWPWLASLDHSGYGRFWNGERQIMAHRVAYQLLVGPIPDGLVIDHLCKVRHCMNPAHLEPVTQGENIRRGRTRETNGLKIHCPKGHPYDEANTYRLDGRRYCRACRKERRRARWLDTSSLGS